MNLAAHRKVLVIDDAPPVRLLVQSFLQRLGVAPNLIHLAPDGEAGLAAFRAERFDLAFVDIEMPGLSGEETVRAMLEEQPEFKAIVMTAVDAADARVKQLRSSGAFAVLPKPVRLEALRQALDLLDEEASSLVRIR